ncbi:MAG: carbohydrate ABC transporter permease [Oscillospiraceae bacterium]|jgi:multiple sugar transport system permease protein/putative aldouronate transport system permease protein|nr:carbohydrate ABC transporter permease [Oscillospiraceae bacterium]
MKKNLNAIRLSSGDRIFNIINLTLLSIIMVIVLYPLIYILSASFSNSNAVMAGRVWLFPVEPTLAGYEAVFKNPQIPRSFVNTIYLTVAGTMVNIAFTIMLAYPLSRKTLFGRGVITGFITFTMLFSGGLIPSFLLIKGMGLYNTYWALILPGAVSVYNVIVARTFFQSNIPDDLYEAASLDGCSDIYFMWKIVLPLSAPIIAVLTMFYAVGHWNSYFNAMIYLQDSKKFTLQVVLRNILIANQIDNEMMKDIDAMQKQEGLAQLLKYSLIVVASVPMLVLYPFIQKHFVKGIMIGALKG